MGRFGMKMIKLTAEGIARRAKARRAKLDAVAAAAYADYQSGDSITEVARKHGGRSNTAMRGLFETRGWPMRANNRKRQPHRADGCFAAATLLTDAQANAIADAATDLRVPDALKLTWRKWTLARRAAHLARIRARLPALSDLPTGPYSANVVAWSYGSEAAHAIADRMNVGRNSQTKLVSIKTNSQGVIFEGSLWFWKPKTGYARGPLRADRPLELLHHHIWALAQGKPVPSSHVLRYRDGNANNLTPENLCLITRDDLARENQGRALQSKSRALTTALLNRSQGISENETITHLRHSSFRR